MTNGESGSSYDHELNAARLRHGSSIVCDRCGDTLTLSSMTAAALEPHLLRTSLELGWQVSAATSRGLVADSDAVAERDLCPACHRIFRAVPPKSR